MPWPRGRELAGAVARVHGLRAAAAGGNLAVAQPRLIYDSGSNDGLQPRRNSQPFPPSADTGFQHRLFLLPTSIFIRLVQNQRCKWSRLDAEWVQAALAPPKSKGDAAILTHTA